VARQLSKTKCVHNVSFGCADDRHAWVAQGCRARLNLSDGVLMDCGYEGMKVRSRYECEVPHTSIEAPAGEEPDCNCMHSGPAAKQIYRCDKPLPGPNTSLACMGDTRGSGEAEGRCCARPSDGCNSIGMRTCRWHPEQRIAWLHAPKTGTSFMIALARMANDSLPEKAKMPGESRVAPGKLEWDAFFASYPRQKWFQGSHPWWYEGMTHAAIGKEVYDEYRGRFFGMFRDPRARGWSAYNFFMPLSTVAREWWPPEDYAKCLAGLQVGMLSSQVSSQGFGSVKCHIPPHQTELVMQLEKEYRHNESHGWISTSSGNSSSRIGAGGRSVVYEALHGLRLLPSRSTARCRCRPFVPDVRLAKQRVAEGFTFAGLVDEWALSMCLFAVRFAIKCVPALFANSRPTATNNATHRTPQSVYESDPVLYSIFADEDGDGALYAFIKRRFHDQLEAFNVTPGRCAAEICPSAKQHFSSLTASLRARSVNVHMNYTRGAQH